GSRLPIALGQLEHPRRLGALLLVALLVDETARRLAEGFDPLCQRRTLAETQVERPASGAKRLIDAGQHPPQAAGAVRREEPQAARVVARAELAERLPGRPPPPH